MKQKRAQNAIANDAKETHGRFPRRLRPIAAALLAVFISASFQAASGQGTENRDSTYRRTEVSPGVWSIVEDDSVNMFLVVGSKSALLIDTGYGRGNLAAYVGSITDLPVTVVNTHGHPDHSGGDSRFAEIHAHPADMSAVKSYMSGKSRFVPVTDGYAFDLGGRSLTVIETPGHTAGSVSLLDGANRLLFTGDNNNGHVWLFLRESLPLETYLKSLDRLIARAAEYDLMYVSHGAPYDPAYLLEIRECGKSILSGKASGRPYPRHSNAVAYDYMRAKIIVKPNGIRESK